MAANTPSLNKLIELVRLVLGLLKVAGSYRKPHNSPLF